MNENEIEKNEVEVDLEKDSDSDELAGEDAGEDVLGDSEHTDILLPDSDDSGRNYDDDISSGDSGQAVGSVSSGDSESSSYVSAGDAVPDPVESDTQITSSTLAQDYTADILPLAEGIDTLNSTLVLILFFLLFDWTSKKISLAVRRFSGEGRKN